MKKILPAVFSLLLCLSFVLSLVDANELPVKSDFNHDNIYSHIEKICEVGPHSIIDKEENKQVQDYIISELESLGIVNSDTTEAPAYLVQSFVTTSRSYQSFCLDNIIVHIPANSPQKTNQAVMTMAHFDSVATGQGAADDGCACATMLEAIRYYLDRMQNGYTIENDLVFCFVNGEEYGLLGSEAFMKEFSGFDSLVERINFAINLEARGTSGTQIMFETAANNYNTVKLFGEVNKNLFTCSTATMIYDMMPNGTDFSNLKTHYQGVNIANIAQGENYHTRNDSPENIRESTLTQQAQIVNRLLDKLGNYDLDKLYEAEESAIFFSYLNIGDVVYSHAASVVFAVIGILLLGANIVISAVRKKNNLAKTSKAILVIIMGIALTAGLTFGCYYLFQLIAALAGTIDFNMIGMVSYSNTAVIVGIALLALGVTTLTACLGCRLFKIEAGDIRRAFSCIHVFIGIVMTFALPDASYLFIFSGLMLMINELAVTLKPEVEKYRFELLAEAIYLPAIMPIVTLAVSALGLGLAYVFGVLFAIAIFGVSSCIAPVCGYFSINFLLRKDKSKPLPNCAGAVHVIAAALVIFLCISLTPSDVHSDLGGGFSHMDNDALIYSTDNESNHNYCVYDLSAYKALKKYCPEMEYDESIYGYSAETEKLELDISSQITTEGRKINVKRAHENSVIYLTLMDASAESFTVDDGTTVQTVEFSESGYAYMMIHSDCTVTVNGGTATAFITEYIVDYPPLIPENYDPEEKLHFNLWLQKTCELS
ncbi:MAG: M28 family peptidase [Oscillospiraceae bacterium]|nr:M28 family peptidase [Oscillospiraceae bacterium]